MKRFKCFNCDTEPGVPLGREFRADKGVCPECGEAERVAEVAAVHLTTGRRKPPLCLPAPEPGVSPLKKLAVELTHVTAVPEAATCPACLEAYAERQKGEQ